MDSAVPRGIVMLFAVAFLITIGSAQSPAHVAAVQTFHVEGTIDSITNGFFPPVQVVFEGDGTNQRVTVDDKGFYQIDLPLGTYSMTAEFPKAGLTKYRRFFRVKAPATIHLDGALYD